MAEVVVSALTLEDLVAVVKREHTLVLRAGVSMVDHAIRAGEALLAARDQVESGKWQTWLRQLNGGGDYRNSLQVYMRLAYNKDLVVESGVPSIRAALQLLSDRPDARRVATIIVVEEEVLQRVRDEEISIREAARLSGCSPLTVRRRLGIKAPSEYQAERQRARNRREKLARRALRREEQESAMRRAKGPRKKAYSLVRQAALALQQALEEADDRQDKAHLTSALRRLHRAEDEIVKARMVD